MVHDCNVVYVLQDVQLHARLGVTAGLGLMPNKLPEYCDSVLETR